MCDNMWLQPQETRKYVVADAEEVEGVIDKDHRCKGCGAPIRGRTCEYCGRLFEAEHTTGPVIYANNIPIIGVEKMGSTFDRLQYQASQERQIDSLIKLTREGKNVAI